MLHSVESQKFDYNKVVFSNYVTNENHIEKFDTFYTTIETKNIFSITEVDKNYTKTDTTIFHNIFSEELQKQIIKNGLRYKFDKKTGLVYEYYSFKINNTLEFTYFEKELAESEHKKIIDLMTPKTKNQL